MKKILAALIASALCLFLGFISCSADENGNAGGDGEGKDAPAGDDDDDDDFTGACIVDEDCPADKICVSGVCTMKECEADGDCAGEKKCEAGKCVDPPPPATCAEDSECAGGRKCIEGTCQVPGCASDEDCQTGYKCDGTTWQCVPGGKNLGDDCSAPEECKQGLYCFESKCVMKCESDADCTGGMVCTQVEFGISVCKQGDGTCQVDSQCKTGEVCVNGKCVEDSGCKSDADCATPGAEHCDTVTGDCVECTETAHCGTDQICSGNICAEAPPFDAGVTDSGSSEECTSASDCTDPVKKICDAFGTGKCVECLGDLDCQQGYCCNEHKSCVACGSSDGGVTDSGGPVGGDKCDPCQTDADCQTGLKCVSGMMGGDKYCGTGDFMADIECSLGIGDAGMGGDGGFPFP